MKAIVVGCVRPDTAVLTAKFGTSIEGPV